MNITEYTLPSADSRPRRQAIDADDVIWYADFPRGYVGKFDTKTGKLVKEYLSPSGPHLAKPTISRPAALTLE